MMESSTLEKCVRQLELRLQWLASLVASVKLTADKAAQDASQGQQPTPMSDGWYRCQVTVAIPATSGATLTTGGAVKIITVPIGSRIRYYRYPNITVTDPANDTGGPIPINTYCIGHLVDGLFTIFIADCITVSPAATTDEPH